VCVLGVCVCWVLMLCGVWCDKCMMGMIQVPCVNCFYLLILVIREVCQQVEGGLLGSLFPTMIKICGNRK